MSEIFGVEGYKVTEPPSGGLQMVRPDGTTVAMFGESIPENALRRIAQHDRVLQSTFREMQSALLVNLDMYLTMKAKWETDMVLFRELVRGGAILQEFGPVRQRTANRRG